MWKPVEGYGGRYEVSREGRVRSNDTHVNAPQGTRLVKGRVLKPYRMPSGYLQVSLHSAGAVCRKEYVHRLVATTFIGQPPSESHEVNHIDGDKSNNDAGNLEWVTRKGNYLHARRAGLNSMIGNSGEEHPSSKLTKSEVKRMLRLRHEDGWLLSDLSEEFGVCVPHVSVICRGKEWTHVYEEVIGDS